MIGQAANPQRATLRDQLREYEVSLIVDALERVHGNQLDASILLGIPLRTLVYKLEKYAIRERFRARRAQRSALAPAHSASACDDAPSMDLAANNYSHRTRLERSDG